MYDFFEYKYVGKKSKKKPEKSRKKNRKKDRKPGIFLPGLVPEHNSSLPVAKPAWNAAIYGQESRFLDAGLHPGGSGFAGMGGWAENRAWHARYSLFKEIVLTVGR